MLYRLGRPAVYAGLRADALAAHAANHAKRYRGDTLRRQQVAGGPEMEAKLMLGGLPIGREKLANFKYHMLPGDCLVYSGSKPVQELIKLWGRPHNSTIGLSHASVIIRPMEHWQWQREVFSVEATGSHGLHPVILSQELMADHGRCFHISTNLTKEQRIEAEAQALLDACLGINYDFTDCFLEILKHADIDPEHFFCSEYVGYIYNTIGYTQWETAPRPNDLPVWLPKPCAITELII